MIQIACMPLASDQIISLQNLLKEQHTCCTNPKIDRIWRSVKKCHPSRYTQDTKCHFLQKKSAFYGQKQDLWDMGSCCLVVLHNVPILPETLICRVIFQSKCERASVAGDSTKSRCDRKSFQIRPRSWDQVLFCGRSADTERWWSDVWEIKSPTKFGKSRRYFTKHKLFLSWLVSHSLSFTDYLSL